MTASSSKAETGRTLTLVVVIVTISISALVITSFVLFEGIYRLPQQLVRFGLTCLLGWFLYRKATWARWLGGAGYLWAGWSGLSTIANNPEAFGSSLVFLVMGVAYGACGAILLLSPEVRAYFALRESAG